MSEYKSFDEILKEVSHGLTSDQTAYEHEASDQISPLVEEEVIDILKHCAAHFGDRLDLMLAAYQMERAAAVLDVGLEEIERLIEMERAGQDKLAPLLLSGADAEEIAAARKAYSALRDIYDVEEELTDIPRLMADLILSEEEEPTAEIAAIVARGRDMVTPLVELLTNDLFSNPLFPGYGRAPSLAAICLGKLKAKSAIPQLFDSIGRSDFFADDILIKALAEMGEEGISFVIDRLHSRPVGPDNVKAAMVLAGLPPSEAIANAAWEQLQEPQIRSSGDHALYLTLCCSSLMDPTRRQQLKKLADDVATDPEVADEIRRMSWD